ncbi:type IV pilus assembly protein PilP [Oceanisphaera litoralis]|uniref:pilus assembly protein PilP n=1 Tax=Oceanisphaera litoralis TaxID=225144 RepID=UPI00195EFD08|nr:pilus assembly protein PilP [Oceanisphaera litoralis]MBM7456900.1 type IV pilus assembly protein PilP [Oceanisphaera litoralis]
MRVFCLLTGVLLLTACIDDQDLGHYVAEVKARPATPPEPQPKSKEFVPDTYQPGSERSPFGHPQPENSKKSEASAANCELPNHDRPPEELERYSLDNLSLRGTLGDQRGLSALIRTQDGVTHRVTMGQRMGLNLGEVVGITPDELILKEYILDGRGCWENRETRLLLSETK